MFVHLQGEKLDEQAWALFDLVVELRASQVPRLLSKNLHHHLLPKSLSFFSLKMIKFARVLFVIGTPA